MKMRIKYPFLLTALITWLGLIPAGQVRAQSFTTLYSFTAKDGAGINGLILSGNTLYGTGVGTVFAVNTDGTGFTNLYSFTGGSDGANPSGSLIFSSNTVYGTAAFGGISQGVSGDGVVFKVNTDGTGFATLHSFTAQDYGTNSDGAYPWAGLVLSGNTLYGTASHGGGSGRGTVFAVNTDGTGFTTLYSFTGGGDGGEPAAGLILSNNTLYGTAAGGGSWGGGTVFAVNTDGTGFTNLHSFAALPSDYPTTNSDGAYPVSSLTLSGNTLYGTTSVSGPSGNSTGNGTVFKVNIDGTGFSNLYTFNGGSDGVRPQAGLTLITDRLYGTTIYGGSSGNGTVFKVNTDGTDYTTLHSFTAHVFNNINSDGYFPVAGLVLSGNILYGTASGGSGGNGTIFSISLPVAPPQLTIIPSGANIILTWPTNATGFTLQSTTDLVSQALWTTVSLGPVVVNGQNTLTNPIFGAQQFYRLAQ
jgi:uncharacterized repeat protein (TIGR03803 family)